MPSVPCPQFDSLDRFSDSLNASNSAYGKEGVTFAVPENDAVKISLGRDDTSKEPQDRVGADNRTGPETPLEPTSIATKSVDAPPLGAQLPSNLHEDHWLDPSKPAFPRGRKG